MPKFFKKLLGMPGPIIDALFQCYCWGFDDHAAGIEKKTREQVKESLNKGFVQGVQRRKS